MNNELTVLNNQPDIPMSFDEPTGNPAQSLGHRVEALRVLVSVLLREVESLENSVPSGVEILANPHFSLPSEIERYEADMIRTALIKSQGKQRRAARLLGVKVTTLNTKIKKYKINWRVVGLDKELVS